MIKFFKNHDTNKGIIQLKSIITNLNFQIYFWFQNIIFENIYFEYPVVAEDNPRSVEVFFIDYGNSKVVPGFGCPCKLILFFI